MRLSIDSFPVAIRWTVAASALGALLTTGSVTASEPDAGAVTSSDEDRSADDAIAALVTFLDRGDQAAAADRHEDRNGDGVSRDHKRRGRVSPRPGRPGVPPRPERGEAIHPHQPNHAHHDHADHAHQGDERDQARRGPAFPPGQRGPIVLPPKGAVFSFDFNVGPDGTIQGGPGGIAGREVQGLAATIARQLQVIQGAPAPGAPQPTDGPHHLVHPHPQGQFFQVAPGPHPDPQAHVAERLEQILGKLNAIEARLGAPGPQGPFHGPQPPQSQPGMQFQPGMPGPGMGMSGVGMGMPGPGMGMSGVGMMFPGAPQPPAPGGNPEEFRRHQEELVRMHERLQEAFQDIRRRFGEQQERIERLEQEVRRLREKFGDSGARVDDDATNPESGWSLAPSHESGLRPQAVVPQGPATY